MDATHNAYLLKVIIVANLIDCSWYLRGERIRDKNLEKPRETEQEVTSSPVCSGLRSLNAPPHLSKVDTPIGL